MTSPLIFRRKPVPIKEQIEEALKSAMEDSELPVVRDKEGNDQNEDRRDSAIGQLCGAEALVEDPDTGLYITIWNLEEYGVEPLHESFSLKSYDKVLALPQEWLWQSRIPLGA